jgi:hypothetical protein
VRGTVSHPSSAVYPAGLRRRETVKRVDSARALVLQGPCGVGEGPEAGLSSRWAKSCGHHSPIVRHRSTSSRERLIVETWRVRACRAGARGFVTAADRGVVIAEHWSAPPPADQAGHARARSVGPANTRRCGARWRDPGGLRADACARVCRECEPPEQGRGGRTAIDKLRPSASTSAAATRRGCRSYFSAPCRDSFGVRSRTSRIR